MSLGIQEFAEFFRACHDNEPFNWQRELAARVLKSEAWPQVLRLPTAAGKTAVLDIAVFALAAEASKPPSSRTSPRRIVFVVDRRLVVDSTAERADRIVQRLQAARNGILERVRDALMSLGGEDPLRAAVLRGGMVRDERWARTPLQPTVLVSTVDQVGSRLLHRGYGLSPSAWPIHAGLLANDALIVLDEVHLSRPFEDTLGWIARYRTWGEQPPSAPFAVVRMSATPGQQAEAFPEDPALVMQDPRLQPRLAAPKPVTLDSAPQKKDATFVATCAEHAHALAARPGVTVAVVVNRVGTARTIWRELDAATRARKRHLDAQAILLTGRSRPIERDTLVTGYRGRFMAGRDRGASAQAPALIVVATQCIEAGADFDFDAMVTECCPLDSLRQRLGRLNRIGALPIASAVVIARAETADGSEDDPVYGAAAHRTWEWLKKHEKGLDLAAGAVENLVPEDFSELTAPVTAGPLVFPAYCDLWAQTEPVAVPSPDPAVFLHGPNRGEPEVQLVWRADLDPERPETWVEAVALCPPVSAEALSLRISVVRAWLADTAAAPDESDVPQPAAEREEEPATGRAFLRWLGPEDTRSHDMDPAVIRPGDTIVIPSSYGGCDRFGWAPERAEPVDDLAGPARHGAKRPPVLRLDPGLRATWGAAADMLLPLVDVLPDAEDANQRIAEGLRRVVESAGADIPGWLRATCRDLLGDRRRTTLRTERGWIVLSNRRWSGEAADFGDEGVEAGAASAAVGLEEHCVQVERMARRYATGCGLSETLGAALSLAARAHDLGKADPRFQALLCGGDRLVALREANRLGGPLAKSPRVSRSPSAAMEARRRSGYPDGARHEMLSIRLLESAANWGDPETRDLVLHLIASHHGRCRPFAPCERDPAPVDVHLKWAGVSLNARSETGLGRVDGGVVDRFWRLVRRHGWWGLSYLEALLRLADHRVSEGLDGGKEAG